MVANPVSRVHVNPTVTCMIGDYRCRPICLTCAWETPTNQGWVRTTGMAARPPPPPAHKERIDGWRTVSYRRHPRQLYLMLAVPSPPPPPAPPPPLHLPPLLSIFSLPSPTPPLPSLLLLPPSLHLPSSPSPSILSSLLPLLLVSISSLPSSSPSPPSSSSSPSLNCDQSANCSDPARSCSMTSYGLPAVLHLGGAHMTSYRHHGVLHVVLDLIKNERNQICMGSHSSQCHHLILPH